jgi:hypothetical protein
LALSAGDDAQTIDQLEADGPHSAARALNAKAGQAELEVGVPSVEAPFDGIVPDRRHRFLEGDASDHRDARRPAAAPSWLPDQINVSAPLTLAQTHANGRRSTTALGAIAMV